MSDSRPLADLAFGALDRGDADVLNRFELAVAADPGNPVLRIGEAEARFRAGADDPFGPLASLVARSPSWIEGQAALASLRWESGDREGYADGYKAALSLAPSSAELWNGYIATLANACDYAAAADAAREARRYFDVPMLRLIEASHAGMAGDLDRAAELLDSLPRDMPQRWPVEVRHLLRTGRADAAEDVLKPERARAPGDISLWALTDVVWRLLGDERAAWLSGQPGFVATTALALERADLERIAATLRGLHLPRAQPIGQSVRGGTQTRGRLFDRADPAIRQLRDAVQAALGVYLAGLPPADEEHPLLRHRDRALRIEGSWSVRLVDEGYHVAHLHPAGVLSSACHLVVPALDSSSCEGWLELGRPPADLMLDLAPLKIVEPRAGGLILFPSYLYHGTRPFRAGERLTVAFDAA